jgi:hypothetical protein
MDRSYSVGDPVMIVSGLWKLGTRGVVCPWPDRERQQNPVINERPCRNGVCRVLWILFEEEQWDSQGDGPYIGGEVLEADVKPI